jgi:hypothetical protein
MPKPPSHVGNKICAAAAALVLSSAPKAPSTAGGMCSNKRTVHRRRQAAHVLRSVLPRHNAPKVRHPRREWLTQQQEPRLRR